jgi:hypothetical protein
MKFSMCLLAAFLCCAAAQSQTAAQDGGKTGSANRVKQPASAAARSLTGCVDEQNGRYVMRDTQTSQLVTLQSTGPDSDSQFAKFLGHQVRASGTVESGTLKVTHIVQTADMCGTGK